MTQGTDFRITYTTLSSPSDEVHRQFDRALEAAETRLGELYPLWIGGERAVSEATSEDRSPIDRNLLIGDFQLADQGQVARAVETAAAAYPAWSRTPWQERVAILRRAAEAISARRYELAAIMTLEVGKNRSEGLADAEEAADLLRYYCTQMEEAEGFSRSMGRLSPNENTFDILRPYGVWVVISPFNFPVALPAGMSAGALVAGNTAVFKPAPEAALGGLRLWEILRDAGLPPGVMNFVTGGGQEVGEVLTSHPGVAGLVFTGSRAVGHSIYRQFNAARPRPCFLELGGKNPAIVTANADLDKAAEGVVRASLGFSGQKCSACSRVYVDRRVMADFKDLLMGQARAMKVGDPRDRDSFLGPVINQQSVERFEQATVDARRDGRILMGGEVLRGDVFDRGYYVAPTVVEGLPSDHRLMRDELFLPLVCVAEVESIEHAIEEANRTEYGLTAGIFSDDPAEVEVFFDRIEAGVTYANRRSGATTGAWPGVNPFCGWKASGSTGKGVCGPYYVSQFLREQSRTIME